jgi:protein-S-isoprenylcysteine O-methyltransferase Ste14
MMQWLPISMFGVIAVSAIAANALKNASDKDLSYVKDDHTIWIFRVLMPFSVIFSFVLAQLDPWKFNQLPLIDLIAACLFVVGMSIRWIAIASLKKAFTVKVSILKDHQLKTDGVYRWVRHPSYTGMYIYGLGYGLAFQSFLCTALVLLALLLPALFATPPEPLALFTLILMAAASWEWGRLNGLGFRPALTLTAICISLCAASWLAGWAVQAPAALWWTTGLAWLMGGAWMLRRGVLGWGLWPRGARWVGGAGRSRPLFKLGSTWARCGLFTTMWYSGAPVRGSEWRGVATEVVYSTDGTGRAPRGKQGFSLDCPFGSRFAAAMLR